MGNKLGLELPEFSFAVARKVAVIKALPPSQVTMGNVRILQQGIVGGRKAQWTEGGGGHNGLRGGVVLYNDGSQCVEILRREASNQIVATQRSQPVSWNASGWLLLLSPEIEEGVIANCLTRQYPKHTIRSAKRRNAHHMKKVLSSNQRMLKKGASNEKCQRANC